MVRVKSLFLLLPPEVLVVALFLSRILFSLSCSAAAAYAATTLLRLFVWCRLLMRWHRSPPLCFLRLPFLPFVVVVFLCQICCLSLCLRLYLAFPSLFVSRYFPIPRHWQHRRKYYRSLHLS